jgi:hypothetical protein
MARSEHQLLKASIASGLAKVCAAARRLAAGYLRCLRFKGCGDRRGSLDGSIGSA